MENIAELYRTLGVEMPQEPEGEQEQEIAAPAETGEQEQEIAAPAASDEGSGEEREMGSDQEPDKKQLTKEERAANAARRRQQEIDDAVSAALEKERSETNARWKKFLDQAQLKQGDILIDSLEKAEQWAEQDRIAKLQQNLKSGKLTQEDLQAVMEQSPAFQAMQKQLAESSQSEAKLIQQQFERNLEMEFAQIQKLNPKINSLADILAMETGPQWAVYVQKHGMNYLDAYKMANMDQLMQQTQRAAEAGEQLRRRGKDHLQPLSARGQGGIEVPKRIKELYRMGRPNMTDAEIEADYRKRAGKA